MFASKTPGFILDIENSEYHKWNNCRNYGGGSVNFTIFYIFVDTKVSVFKIGKYNSPIIYAGFTVKKKKYSHHSRPNTQG